MQLELDAGRFSYTGVDHEKYLKSKQRADLSGYVVVRQDRTDMKMMGQIERKGKEGRREEGRVC